MPSPVLVDTDPGCDDAIALLLALEHPGVDLVGLSTVHGNAPVDDTTANARAILERFDETAVPIAKGTESPLVVDLETAEHIHGPGGIRGDLPEPTAATRPVETHAAQFIVEQARCHEGDLVLAAIGPLTNVALALALEPTLPDLLDELVVMGGAAFTSGNATPLAEANFHSDPEAARKVVAEAEPTIVGLDVTTRATLPPAWIDSLPRDEPRSRSIHEWLTYYDEAMLERYGIESAAIHDALAIAGIVDGTVLETEAYAMDVGTDSALDRGALVCDGNGVLDEPPNGTVAVDADVERFRELVIDAVEGAL